MILNVLIVDDEYIVLKGLEIMLSEQTVVNLKIQTAMDSTEAMRKLTSFHPDVILADINMPEIDGLTMLRQISLRCPACKFIICSGYEDSDYLREALRLHVCDYLLKPIDKKYLINRLKEISDEKQIRISHILSSIQLFLFKGRHFHQYNFRESELDLIFSGNNFALCIANIPQAQADQAEKQLAQYFDSIYAFVLSQRSIFLINYSFAIRSDDIRSIINTILAPAALGLSIFPSYSDKITAIQSISLRYQEALSDMVLTILPLSSTNRELVYQKICRHTLHSAIQVITFETGIDNYINEVYDKMHSELSYLTVFTELFSAYIFISDICIPPDNIVQTYLSYQKSANDRHGLILFVKKALNFWYDSFTPLEHASYSSKIASVCHYIEQHYAEDLSLELIADMHSINSSYLSYIFKKETGITFLQYITNIRMHHACQLMLNFPDLSLEEIAERTGYHSSSYFHKIFRAKFGVSPRQWHMQNK